MAANDTQVGGSHYKVSYEHWDFIHELGIPYLEAVTTKYVTRWRKKDGRQDLHKALHYLTKLEETSEPIPRWPSEFTTVGDYDKIARFCAANGLSEIETAYIRILVTWSEKHELAQARELLFLLMDEAEALEKEPKSVPLMEENHHTERADPNAG